VEVPPGVSTHSEALPAPTQEDDASDLERLRREIGPVTTNLRLLGRLPVLLREGGFAGTAVVCMDRLIDFEMGDTREECFGVAFDLGTTTVVCTLIDLCTGRELGVEAGMNPQVSSGDDVISRILRTREDPTALREMQSQIVAAMNGLMARLRERTGVARNRVYEATVAGNTTMQHLFCGISPQALGEVPFPPAYSHGLEVDPEEVGLEIHPDGTLYVFPNVGGFVGGDTVAGMLATSLDTCPSPRLLVDIGTNGEIVLAANGSLLSTSTAAGPAFEGARIAAGMRATTGAIEKVLIVDHDLSFNVIGNTPPAGICGTALIDLVAELLRAEVIDPTGRILSAAEAPATTPPGIRERLHENAEHVDVLLVRADESRTGEPIYLYQRDVRELQLATGAIRAGIQILLRRAGIEPDDLDHVLLAGAFGNFIRRRNASRIGLLPALPTSRILFVGNAASMGAKAALLNREARSKAEALATRTEHVDLSLDPEFQMEFGMAMMFPESDVGTGTGD
jgi:uncharacterized 2Fe-2S/4Fe-4S cluster protein (DUF4445 family)